MDPAAHPAGLAAERDAVPGLDVRITYREQAATAAMRATISYGPIRVPGVSDIGAVSQTTRALRVQGNWREYGPERAVRLSVSQD